MGYGERQMADLAATIENVPCDLVLVGTPIDLARIISIRRPSMRVTYELAEHGDGLARALERAVAIGNPVRA